MNKKFYKRKAIVTLVLISMISPNLGSTIKVFADTIDEKNYISIQ